MANSILIAGGVYREPAKGEIVTVQGEEIEFQIDVREGEVSRVQKRKYKYYLLPGGQIHVIASSNDPAFVFGIMKYDWIWDGKAIVRKDSSTGSVSFFQRE